MLRQIQLLILDLDYLVFDSVELRMKALRESLLPFADAIPHDVRLPDAVDVEEGFRDHGFRWIRQLEIGLGEPDLEELQGTVRDEEIRLAAAGLGRVFPGLREFIALARENGALAAIGADASREYLLSVADNHDLHDIFEMAFCTEEFGSGGEDEMLEEIMTRAGVNPSETLVLGTRPDGYRAARALGILTVGCGWGLTRRDALVQADLQVLATEDAYHTIENADSFLAPDLQ